MSVSDDRFKALFLEGYSGAVSDMLNQWLEGVTGSSGAINDLWDMLMDQEGINPGMLNDRMMEWFKTQGAEGDSYSDLSKDYWFRRANPPDPEK